jgi:hypothetical protein
MPAGEDTPSEIDIVADLTGTVFALEEIVIHLLASQARTQPDGFARKIFGDPDNAVAILGTISHRAGQLPPGFLTAAKEEALRRIVTNAKAKLKEWPAA